MKENRFRIICFITLGVALFVILWGAWVRFSHSGDGCGVHWPLCNDQWIPETDSSKTWTEWFHRASSIVFGFLVLSLIISGFRSFPKKHKVRLWTVLAGVFSLSEALIGAGLVLFGLTGENNSLARLIVLNVHLLNSLCLIACLVFCWRFSFKNSQISFQKILFPVLCYFLVAATGSIASLSNTLFPSTSISQGWMMDFDPESPWLIQLRILHPLLAFFIGGFFLFYVLWKLKENNHQQNLSTLKKENFWHWIKKIITSKKYYVFAGCLFLSLTTGFLTLLTLSPVALKLTHISLAYLIWIAFLALI